MRLACLLLLLPLAFAALEARKEVAGGPHQFIVSVSYRWTGSGKGSDVTVEDELPNTLALLGGSLVRKLPAATAQWQSVQYTVGASEELVFTLQNRSFNITLPAARFSYQPAETKQRETVETAPVTLTIWHPSVEGTWSASWLVMLVAWVLPVVAAYVSIGALSAAPAPAAAAAAKPKKN